MTDTGNPPAGWYPDPGGQGRRYWDGARWTDQVVAEPAPPPAPGTTGAPETAVPGAVTPSRPDAPTVPGQPSAPGSGRPPLPSAPGAAAGPVRASGPSGPSGFAATIQGLDALLIVMVAAGLFFFTTFLDWYGGTVTDPQTGQKISDSTNGWDGDSFWMLLGPGATEAVQKAASGETASGQSDLFLILPLAAGAGVLAFLIRTGKGKPRFAEAMIALGAAAALLVLLEAQSFSSKSGDAGSQLAQYGVDFDGGARIGLWLGFLCCCGVVAGAVKHRLDAAKTPATPF